MSKNGKADNSGPILLTGAGFTKNFGGLLAQDMWALIFNHEQICENEKLAGLLKRNFDYESVYHQVLYETGFEHKEKEIIKQAINKSYNRLDNLIVETNYGGKHLGECRRFIETFSELKGGGGFFFTLNQDLFVERFLAGLGGIHMPFSNRANSIWASLRNKPLESSHYIPLPRTSVELEREEPLSASKFHYIKLHGSLNWQRSDGSGALVIGKSKESEIAKEPLLDRYFSLFNQEINKTGRKLLCIGYGFGDIHINETISQGTKRGLKLYVISPSGPKEFKEKLQDAETPYGNDIWERLAGYYPYKFLDILTKETFADVVKRAIF